MRSRRALELSLKSHTHSLAGEEPRGDLPVGESARILVVEDNSDAAEMLSLLLEELGHEVKVATDAANGLGAAEAWLPHVVLSDIGLPGDIDGYGLARALRSSSSTELAAAYLIALSGYGQDSDKERARAAGFDLHLTKPFEPRKLPAMLSEALRTVERRARSIP